MSTTALTKLHNAFGTLTGLLKALESISGDDFRRAFPEPFLLAPPATAIYGAPAPHATRTPMGDTTRVRRLTALKDYQVFVLKKRAGANAFPSMITVGRGKSNDIVLSIRGVSRFHAHFVREGEHWKVQDAKSTYGTTVDGVLLESGSAVRVPDDAEICFASAGCRFVSARSLLELAGRED